MQKAKRWLYQANKQYDGSGFPVQKRDGGIAGSLVGLGFIKRGVKLKRPSGYIDQNQYQITPEGQEWIKNQGVK